MKSYQPQVETSLDCKYYYTEKQIIEVIDHLYIRTQKNSTFDEEESKTIIKRIILDDMKEVAFTLEFCKTKTKKDARSLYYAYRMRAKRVVTWLQNADSDI